MRKARILWLAILLVGCKSTSNVSGPESFANYQESLSLNLPDYPDFQLRQQVQVVQPSTSQLSVDGALKEIQKGVYEKNKSEAYFGGFTVLVYSGIDRNQAFKTRDEIVASFPEIEPEMQYQQPRYLVKVGKYAYKFEAQRIFSTLKSEFPTARIIQDRFQRKEYLPPVTNDQNAQGQN